MPETKLPEINKNYKPTDKEQDLREWVYQRKQQMEDASERQRAEKVWDAGEKAWDQYRPEKGADDWQSNYYAPITTSIIESILAELIEQMPQPLILPRGQEDIWRARVMQKIFEYTWQVADGDLVMQDVMRGTLMHGTAIAQEYYLKDRRMVKNILGLSKQRNKRKQRQYESEEKTVYEYDDCLMEWISPWDFLVDEKAREVNQGIYKARDVVRRYIMNYRDAKEFFSKDPIWDHLNNFRFVRPGGDTDYYQFYKPPEGIDHSEEVEVLWYWSRTPEDLLVILINDVVVRMGPNIYKHKQLPFAKAIDVNRLGKFYGKGEPEMLDSIQEEANTIRRMIIDRNHLDIDKSFIVSPDQILDDEDLIARPHGLIPGDPSMVTPIEYRDIPLSVQATLKEINEDKIILTGVDDRFQSVQKAPSTATEAAILKESTLKRIRMKLRNYEKRFLVDIGRMRTANILQFYSQPKLEKIVGERGTEEFKREITKLTNQGLIERREGELYKRQFKEITTEGRELFFDERGKVQERKKPGFHFFELRPEYFMPVARGGYDIRFEAGPSLPVSKPLMQSKIAEMFDRLLPIAMPELSNYDPEKLGDELVKANELNPEDLKREEALEEASIEENRIALAVDLAAQENQMLLNGEQIPPTGTPYAPPPHTQMHIEFFRSDAMKGAPEEASQLLLQHITGEIMAIQQRSAGTPGMTAPPAAGAGAAPVSATEGGMGQGAQPVLPPLIQGGGQVPTGGALGYG